MKFYEALTELKRNNFEGYVLYSDGGQVGMWTSLIKADSEGHFKRIPLVHALKGNKGRALSICGTADSTDYTLREAGYDYIREHKVLFSLYLEAVRTFCKADWFKREWYDGYLEEGLNWSIKHGKITTYEADKIKEDYYGIVTGTI